MQLSSKIEMRGERGKNSALKKFNFPVVNIKMKQQQEFHSTELGQKIKNLKNIFRLISQQTTRSTKFIGAFLWHKV